MMTLKTRTLFFDLHTSWTKTTMHFLIICIGIPLILGMPYFGDRSTIEKAYQNGALGDIVNPDSPDVVDDFFEYDRPDGTYENLESLFANRFVVDGEDEDEDDGTFGIMDSEPSIGTRAKRLGFSYFPYRLSRKYNLNNLKARGIPAIIKAIRQAELNPVKRRLAFTPLRG